MEPLSERTSRVNEIYNHSLGDTPSGRLGLSEETSGSRPVYEFRSGWVNGCARGDGRNEGAKGSVSRTIRLIGGIRNSYDLCLWARKRESFGHHWHGHCTHFCLFVPVSSLLLTLSLLLMLLLLLIVAKIATIVAFVPSTHCPFHSTCYLL